MPQLLRLLFATALIATALAVGTAESVPDKGKPSIGAEVQGSVPSGVTVISSVQDPLLDASATVAKTQKAAAGKSALVIRGGVVVRKVGNKHELTRKIEDIFATGGALNNDDVTVHVMVLLGYPLSDTSILRRVKALLQFRRDSAALHDHIVSFVDGLGKPSDSAEDDMDDADDKDDGDDNGNKDNGDDDDDKNGDDNEGKQLS